VRACNGHVFPPVPRLLVRRLAWNCRVGKGAAPPNIPRMQKLARRAHAPGHPTANAISTLSKTCCSPQPFSVQRRLEPLRASAVVLRSADPALGEIGQDGTGARQAGAIHMARCIPQLRAHDRLGALEIDAIDGDRRSPCAAPCRQSESFAARSGRSRSRRRHVHPDGLAAARNEKQQRDMGIMQDVA